MPFVSANLNYFEFYFLTLFLPKVIIPTFVLEHRQSKWNHLSRPDLCGATTRSEIPNLRWHFLQGSGFHLAVGHWFWAWFQHMLSRIKKASNQNDWRTTTKYLLPSFARHFLTQEFHQAGWKKISSTLQMLVLNQAAKALELGILV